MLESRPHIQVWVVLPPPLVAQCAAARIHTAYSLLMASIKVESVTNCISLLERLFLAKHNFFVLSAVPFLLTPPPGRSSLFLHLSPTHELLWLHNPWAAFVCTGQGDKAHQSLYPLPTQLSSSHRAARLSPRRLRPADRVKLRVGSLQNRSCIAKCFEIGTGM